MKVWSGWFSLFSPESPAAENGFGSPAAMTDCLAFLVGSRLPLPLWALGWQRVVGGLADRVPFHFTAALLA